MRLEPLDLLRWAALLTWLAWLLVYWRGGAGLAGGLAKSFRSAVFPYDGYLILGIVLFTNVLLWTGYAAARTQARYEPAWLLDLLTPLGLLMVLAGAAGTLHVRRQLGRFWTVKAELYENHRVVDTGMYRYVRHPIYSFACLMTLGTVLMFPAWWTLLAGAGVVGCYAVKALAEERLLAGALQEYRDYRRRVPYRLAPWIW